VETSRLGFHTLVDLSKSDIDYPCNVFFCASILATDKRAAISGTLRGFVRALRFLREEKEEAPKVVAKRLRNANMDVLRTQWHHVAFEYFGEDLYPTEAGFALAMKEMQGKTGPLRFSEIIDVSHLEELSRSGFFN
jgi:ABC-type nitrate/sulfonate/bicarbonate transport system substrate-binding protein